MKEIPLTQGYVALVDDGDYEELSQFNWYANVQSDGRVYARRMNNRTKRQVSMHRQIAGVPGLVIDHINGNGLDNRRDNLRGVSPAENAQNITKPTRAKTGERNIGTTKNGQYVVECMRFRKRYYGGIYYDLKDAIAARDALVESLEKI